MTIYSSSAFKSASNFAWMFGVFFFGIHSHAYDLSSEFKSAQAAKATAYNRLFRELDQSADPRAAYPGAAKKIMEPAQTQYSKALDGQMNAFISELRKSGVDFVWTAQDFKEDPRATDPELQGDDGPTTKKDPRTQAKGSDDGSGANRGAVIQDTYSRPELVLDGSKIAKEISFPGPKKTQSPVQPPVPGKR